MPVSRHLTRLDIGHSPGRESIENQARGREWDFCPRGFFFSLSTRSLSCIYIHNRESAWSFGSMRRWTVAYPTAVMATSPKSSRRNPPQERSWRRASSLAGANVIHLAKTQANSLSVPAFDYLALNLAPLLEHHFRCSAELLFHRRRFTPPETADARRGVQPGRSDGGIILHLLDQDPRYLRFVIQR